jgi:hypothetical protein
VTSHRNFVSVTFDRRPRVYPFEYNNEFECEHGQRHYRSSTTSCGVVLLLPSKATKVGTRSHLPHNLLSSTHMQPASAEDHYTDMDGYARNRGEKSVDFQGYVDDTIPIDRSDALFSPVMGVEVPDGIAGFSHRLFFDDPSSWKFTNYMTPAARLYAPPAVPSLLPMTEYLPPPPITNPDSSVQLDPDILLLVNHDPLELQMQPMTMAPGLFIGPMRPSFSDTILSPIPEGDQLLANLVIPEYQLVNASTSMAVSPASAPLPTTPSILPFPPADLIIANNETSDYGASATTSSDTATAGSLPIVKLPLGAWKCMICGAKLRRKHRAVVHFWNKHGSMRVECQGRCGVPEW